MRKTHLYWLGSACAAAVAILGYSVVAKSADHLDSPAVVADPAADITDVYTWMDGTNAVFVLNVTPVAATTSKFSDKVQYVIHTASGKFPAPTDEQNIIATFDANQKIQLWLGTSEYLTGDAGQGAGLVSTDGKVKVFAGPRSDPFFFNLVGFKHTVATVQAATLTADPAGCPSVDVGTSGVLVNQLKSSIDGGAPEDFFKNLNVLSIVVSVDKSLVTKGGTDVAVYGSTHKAQ
ncbi:hypothetical protein BH09MYX1_BH09MYX1_44390 [soil metagenome]